MSNENPQETAFDRISRLLATPMPRRQAMRMIAGAAFGMLNVAPLLAQSTANKSTGPQPHKKMPTLKLPVQKFVMHDAAIYDVVNALRANYNAPISYITSESTQQFDINVPKGTVQDVLDQMLAQDASYVYKVISGKVIILPNLAKYQAQVSGVKIAGVPRYEAATDLISYLRAHTAGFENFGAVLAGFIPPELTTPITLTQNSTVLEYFFQLISDDPSIVLSITRSSSGDFYLFLNKVAAEQKPDSAKAHDIAPAIAGSSGQLSAHNISASSNSSSATCRPLSENYQPPTGGGCPSGQCGVMATAALTGITTCSGDDCSGKVDSENVTLNKTNPDGLPVCAPGAGFASGPCPAIGAGNSLNCVDHYTFCISPFPKATCSQTYTQQGLVDGNIVATYTLTYTLNISAGGCQASFDKSDPTSVHTADQCCGNNPPASGAGSKTLCNSPQTCINGDVCCDPGTLAACVHVCCAPKTASYPGDTCITDSVTLVSHCCPAGTPVSCSGVCCPKNNTCVGGNCCPQGQGTSDNKTCCPAGKSPQGTICCPTGQTNCAGVCCAGVCCSGVCCAAGSICCSGSCCAGTCDSSGTCVPPPNEKK